MYDDWDLIEASFAMQYPSKDLYDEEMDWKEFMILLSGIMPETPLGQIVSIRSEENSDILKSFTSEQKKIRDDWRMHMMEEQNKNMNENEKSQMINDLQDVFSKAFG